jgi:hypothetical protein
MAGTGAELTAGGKGPRISGLLSRGLAQSLRGSDPLSPLDIRSENRPLQQVRTTPRQPRSSGPARLIMTARTATDPTAAMRITVVQQPVRGIRSHESRSASR